MHLPLNSERLKKLTESYVVSNQKLKMALGIENAYSTTTPVQGLIDPYGMGPEKIRGITNMELGIRR